MSSSFSSIYYANIMLWKCKRLQRLDKAGTKKQPPVENEKISLTFNNLCIRLSGLIHNCLLFAFHDGKNGKIAQDSLHELM